MTVARKFPGRTRLEAFRALEALAPQLTEAEAAEAFPALIEGLLDSDEYMNAAAAQAVGRIAPRIKDALHRFLEALEHESPRRVNLGRGMSHLGKDAVPHLLRILQDGSPHQRGAAIVAFRFMDSPPKEAIPGLIRGFSQKDATVRASARSALSKSGEAGIDALVAALRDSSELVRCEAVTALGELRQGAKSAFPSIVELLKDPAESVRQAANRALVWIDADAAYKLRNR